MQEKIEGKTEKELKENIDKYLRNYPVAGYGTHQGVVKHENGKYVTYMYRERSCD